LQRCRVALDLAPRIQALQVQHAAVVVVNAVEKDPGNEGGIMAKLRLVQRSRAEDEPRLLLLA